MDQQTSNSSARSLKHRYNSIAGDYYIKARVFKLWHTNRYRAALDLAKTVKANSNILDIGCDGGNFTRSLMKYGNVVGLDLSHSFISYAHDTNHSLSLLIGDGQHLPFRNESFDLVTCLEVLEHVPDPNSLASEVHRVLTPRGIFVAIVPDEDKILWHIIWFFWQIIGRGRVWKDLHISPFNRKRLVELLSPYFQRLVMQYVNLHMLLAVRCEKLSLNDCQR